MMVRFIFLVQCGHESRVFAVTPFTWFDCEGRTGIRNNGMAQEYRDAAKKVDRGHGRAS